jgi:outer membrane receptor protein involved in Fe transport
LKPETANDVELAYGHRFSDRAVVQADVYSASENGPLLGGTFPLSLVPPNQLPSQAVLDQYLQRIETSCGPGYTNANLGVSTTFNAGSARYQGIGLNVNVGLARHLKMIAEWDIQSATYSGINTTILSTNPGLINGAQFYGIPERQGSLALGYQNDPAGFGVHLNGYYVGGPSNGFNRGDYAYANANVSKTIHGTLTLNLGINNVFNSIAQQYGYIGLGVYQPENQFGSDANAFDQGSEEFGLPARQIWFTVTTKI